MYMLDEDGKVRVAPIRRPLPRRLSDWHLHTSREAKALASRRAMLLPIWMFSAVVGITFLIALILAAIWVYAFIMMGAYSG